MSLIGVEGLKVIKARPDLTTMALTFHAVYYDFIVRTLAKGGHKSRRAGRRPRLLSTEDPAVPGSETRGPARLVLWRGCVSRAFKLWSKGRSGQEGCARLILPVGSQGPRYFEERNMGGRGQACRAGKTIGWHLKDAPALAHETNDGEQDNGIVVATACCRWANHRK